MKRIITILLALTAILAPTAAATAQAPAPEALAQQADSAYNARQYAEALKLYTQLQAATGTSAELYYNLGNTYYRLGKLGRAVIAYERALALDPSMQAARDNLRFVNTKIQDKPEDDSSFLDNLHSSVVASLSPDAWAWTAFAVFILTLGFAALYIFTDSVPLRKTGFFGCIILFCLWLYLLLCAYSASRGIANHDAAVVVVPSANLTTSPGAPGKGDKVVPIHEGTRVQVIDSIDIPSAAGTALWYDVKVNNSTRAWLPAAAVEKI